MYGHAAAGFQRVVGLREGFQFVVGRHHVGVAVDLPLFAVIVGTSFREEAGAVEVDVGVQVLLIEVVDARREALREMGVAEQLLITAPFLLSARAVSLDCRERDLVNSMRSISSSSATRLLMYSEPLSA